MTKYLSLSGSNQYFVTPSIQFDEIQMDYIAYENFNGGYLYHIDARTATVTNGSYLLTDGSKNEVYSNFTSLTVNGTSVASGTNSISNGQRIQIVAKNSPLTVPITFFSRYNIMQFMKADVYDVKILLGGVVKAHYDMSTGTVNDQSGNGNNATLTGGTWLDDGTGATGTPVTYTYDTKQTIYKNINLNADTKQSIYVNRLTNYDTKQIQYKNIQTSYDSKQVIYKAIQELFDTEQVFTQEYTQVSYQYDVKIEQYKPIQENIDTKQAIYKDISLDLDTKQIIYKTIQNLYDTLIQIRNEHDETIYATLTIQRVIEHHLRISKNNENTLKIQRNIEHILRI